MIREIRLRYPDAFIATLTQPYTQDILHHNPYLDLSLADDLKKETFWDVVRELRTHRFTDGLLVLPKERAAYQMLLAGIRRRVGVGHKFYEVLTFMKGVSRNNYRPLRHEGDYCMDLARRIGVTTTNITPEIFLRDEERVQARAILAQYGVGDNDDKIFIHTGSGGSAPNWSEHKYFDLMKKIIEQFPEESIKIILTAREMSNDFLHRVRALHRTRIINIVPALERLRAMITLIGAADLFICSSTGPTHIADALNVPCIGIHCHRPMNCIKHWGILNARSANIEVTDSHCHIHCSDDQNTCDIEHGIFVDDVFARVKSFIANSSVLLS